MKLEELLLQLHNKITYFIFLDITTYYPTLRITKATNAKTTKLLLSSGEVYLLSLVGEKRILCGTPIMNVCINPKEIVENKRSYIKFNKSSAFEEWYIAQTEQGLVNTLKTLFKKYNLSPSTYKYLITKIKIANDT